MSEALVITGNLPGPIPRNPENIDMHAENCISGNVFKLLEFPRTSLVTSYKLYREIPGSTLFFSRRVKSTTTLLFSCHFFNLGESLSCPHILEVEKRCVLTLKKTSNVKNNCMSQYHHLYPTRNYINL